VPREGRPRSGHKKWAGGEPPAQSILGEDRHIGKHIVQRTIPYCNAQNRLRQKIHPDNFAGG
jgi:hypothetical protein